MTAAPTNLQDARQFIEQRVYEHFHAHAEWPRAKIFDLEHYERLDPLGGLEEVCRQIGSDRLTCGSITSSEDRITLRWPALMDQPNAADDIRNFLKGAREAADRYTANRGGETTLNRRELAEHLKIDELASKRMMALLLQSEVTGGGSVDQVSIAHFASRVRGVKTLEEYLRLAAAEHDRRLSGIGRRTQSAPVPSQPANVFLSHAAEDAALAHHLANVIRQGRQGVSVFVASRAGDIPTGADWLDTIEAELRKADSYVLLLTPRSVERLWVWYESGAAWMSKRPLVPLTAAGLGKGTVPYPLGARQALSLDSPPDVEEFARHLSIDLPDSAAFCETVAELSRALPHALSTPFEGIEFGDTFLDWAGPLNKLEDLDPVPASDSMVKALKDRGIEALFTHLSESRNQLAKGRRKVFETNRRAWKRELLMPSDGNQVLFVTPPGAVGR